MRGPLWSPACTEAGKLHYREGLSYSEIAKILNKEFGTTFTRSAIASKVSRGHWIGPDGKAAGYNLSVGRPRQTKYVPRPPKPSKPTPFTFKPVILAPEETPAPVALKPEDWIPLEGREVVKAIPNRGFCRWPIGEVGEVGFGYCGEGACKNRDGKTAAYCSTHYARAYRSTVPKGQRLPASMEAYA
jgi:hypothetical protein